MSGHEINSCYYQSENIHQTNPRKNTQQANLSDIKGAISKIHSKRSRWEVVRDVYMAKKFQNVYNNNKKKITLNNLSKKKNNKKRTVR